MLKSIFTWWNGATMGARFDIGRRAGFVGKDDLGNKYFEERKPSLEGRKRRYVIYNGYAEPSKIPPDWHGWLHHTWEEPPTKAPLPHRPWEKPHLPNLTGTAAAYVPPGSILRAEPARRADYEAWSPE